MVGKLSSIDVFEFVPFSFKMSNSMIMRTAAPLELIEVIVEIKTFAL